MREDEAPGRSRQPENLLLAAFLVVLAWTPFPYGSNRLWAELVLGLALGGVLLVWSGIALTGLANATSLTRRLAGPAFCIVVALGWATFQSLNLEFLSKFVGKSVATLAHPVWSMAADALGEHHGAFISV